MAVLHQKAKEEEARQAAILESRRKREAEEARIEAERQRQIDEIRKNAEAQPSSVNNEPEPPQKIPGRVGKGRFSKKAKPPPPKLPAENEDDEVVINESAEPPAKEAKSGMSRSTRQTGLKAKKFSVGQLAAQFGVGKSADITSQAKRSVRRKNHSRKNDAVNKRRVRTHIPNMKASNFSRCLFHR